MWVCRDNEDMVVVVGSQITTSNLFFSDILRYNLFFFPFEEVYKQFFFWGGGEIYFLSSVAISNIVFSISPIKGTNKINHEK